MTIAEKIENIGRGHAEVLMQQIQDCLDDANIGYSDLSRIGVVKGPGSFTGLRVGLAAARGFGLGLNIDVVGVSSLDACESAAKKTGLNEKILTVLDAKRAQAYCKISDSLEPFIDTYEDIANALPTDLDGICGSGSSQILQHANIKPPVLHEYVTAPIDVIAELARNAETPNALPEPLYLRSADAKPQNRFALEMQ